jgi:hypothetical protein
MLSVRLSTLGIGVVRHHVQEPVFEKVQGAVIGPAEPLTGFDHLVENGLDARAPATARRTSLIARCCSRMSSSWRASSASSEATPA